MKWKSLSLMMVVGQCLAAAVQTDTMVLGPTVPLDQMYCRFQRCNQTKTICGPFSKWHKPSEKELITAQMLPVILKEPVTVECKEKLLPTDEQGGTWE